MELADRCANTVLTVSRAELQASCEKALALPGASKLAAFYTDCSRRMSTKDCNSVLACIVPNGDLDDGAPCAARFQCKSGRCDTGQDATGASERACGTCVARTAPGGACRTAGDCEEGAFCKGARGTKAGTCTAPKKRLHAGEACSLSPDELCDYGLFCRQVAIGSLDFTCQGPSELGGICSSSTECVGELSCSLSHRCRQPPAEGEACDGACAAGLGCDATTNKCAPLVHGAPGDACDHGTKRCRGATCEGVVNDGARLVTPGKCVAILPDGARCGTGIVGRCRNPLWCVGGRCGEPDPALCK